MWFLRVLRHLYESAPFSLHTGYDLCLKSVAAGSSNKKLHSVARPLHQAWATSRVLILGTCQQPEECTLNKFVMFCSTCTLLMRPRCIMGCNHMIECLFYNDYSSVF